jgi:hypothetical protein
LAQLGDVQGAVVEYWRIAEGSADPAVQPNAAPIDKLLTIRGGSGLSRVVTS